MSTLAAETSGIDTVETPSGKGRGGENFPVGSWLIRRDLRPHVHAFYRFARNADDVADNSELTPEDKLHRLDRMAEVLEGSLGGGSPAAVAMRASLAKTGTTSAHCHDLLKAFRLDAIKSRYRDWDDLMDYCRYSAAPVGRQLLDLHGEGRETWPPSDALCAALQVLNHIQDCAVDYRALDRVYVPLDALGRAGLGVEVLAEPVASPAMRQVLDELLDRTEALIAVAQALPARVRARGLRWESAVIVALAGRLAQRLRRGDPLAGRVKLSGCDFATAFLKSIFAPRRG
jgi:hydroxysqualene synthase